ncbi:arginase family protein [Candidimonas sp. SYP-B2681]|uniref:arginase family protein n=1 Tax=Candidimonas sp. SYP-B2681 TaxID=2497686 RepID=UPI001F2B4D22|nr:arginase family protein [Candidimonas sp. SYP-B2681]
MNHSTFTVTSALTHFAGRAGDHNDRAMAGSPAIAWELARRLGVDPVVISQPEQALATGWQVELDAARPAFCAMAVRYEQLFKQQAVPFTALSRCAVSLATLPVVAWHRPDAVVVWLDAHADINTPDSTTTGYLGGLALSGPLGEWDSGFGCGLSSANTILVGARDIDPFEQELIARGAVTLIPPGPDIAARVSAAVAGRPVFLHLDCDVLEPGLVPTDYSVMGGLSLTELRHIAEAVATSEVVGLEIAEFEADTTPEGTEAAAHRLLDALQPLLPIRSSAKIGS